MNSTAQSPRRTVVARVALVGTALLAPLSVVTPPASAAVVTSIVSVSSSGAATVGGFLTTQPSVSADGRYVAFTSSATNLVANDLNTVLDVFVRDRSAGTTERVSVSTNGFEGNNNSSQPSISADGRFVAFSSTATNLVSGDTNGQADVFVHELGTGSTTRVSVVNGGAQG
ncbi:MAG: TolB family protein, partial [Micromonosporaceae bacterium]